MITLIIIKEIFMAIVGTVIMILLFKIVAHMDKTGENPLKQRPKRTSKVTLFRKTTPDMVISPSKQKETQQMFDDLDKQYGVDLPE